MSDQITVIDTSREGAYTEKSVFLTPEPGPADFSFRVFAHRGEVPIIGGLTRNLDIESAKLMRDALSRAIELAEELEAK